MPLWYLLPTLVPNNVTTDRPYQLQFINPIPLKSNRFGPAANVRTNCFLVPTTTIFQTL